MVEKLFEELAALDGVEAIALGGSRAGENFDEKSDYDVYLYCTEKIPEGTRREILSRHCSTMEIANQYWETEDNCVLNCGTDIDILYRNLDSFAADVASVVEGAQARNGYTTCFWHNLLTCRIIYDRNGRLAELKKRFSVEYPEPLRLAIIRRNMNLVSDALPAYSLQIRKAASRGDGVSVVHRTAAFMESYFDVIFAANRRTHPGEKRLVELCRRDCPALPRNFEENLARLFGHIGTDEGAVPADIDEIVRELKAMLSGMGLRGGNE